MLRKRVAVLTADYCLGNVTLMMAFAHSLLGPVSFDLLYLLIIASFLGAFLIPPILAAQTSWRMAAAYGAGLIATCVFNIWCLFAASAAF